MAVPPQHQLIKNTLKERYHIDLERYRTDVIADSIIGYIDAPFTVMVHLILWPVLTIGLLSYLGIAYVWPASYVLGIVWLLLAILLGGLSSLITAAFFVAWNLLDHTKNLYEATADTLDVIIDDMRDRQVQLPPHQRHYPTFKEWVQVVRLGLFVPTIREVIRAKLGWPVGDWIGNLAVKVFGGSTDRSLSAMPAEIRDSPDYTPDRLDIYCDKMKSRIQLFKSKSEKVYTATAWVTLMPLRILMFVFLALDLICFLGLWWFLGG